MREQEQADDTKIRGAKWLADGNREYVLCRVIEGGRCNVLALASV